MPILVADIFLNKQQKDAQKRAELESQLAKETQQKRQELAEFNRGKKLHSFLLPTEKKILEPQDESSSFKVASSSFKPIDMPVPLFPDFPNVYQMDPAIQELTTKLSSSLKISNQIFRQTKQNAVRQPPFAKGYSQENNPYYILNNYDRILHPSCSISPISFETLSRDFLNQISSDETSFLSHFAQFYETFAQSKVGDQNPLWTEKYRPHSLSAMIGDKDQLAWIVDFLKSWQGIKPSIASQFQNTLIISGAKGIGKTSAVYAVADDLGLRVLEINPSSKRSRKDVLDLFGEATQSHQLDRYKVAEMGEVDEKAAANSIILFEEVDILFEEDGGFLKAVTELGKTSKRPIIMTSNS